MPEPAPVRAGFERPAFLALATGLIHAGALTCTCDVIVGTVDELREHYRAGHFDRRPLNTSHLPPARRILGRGAGPRD